MDVKRRRLLTGCLVMLTLFCGFDLCLTPVGLMVGSISSGIAPDLAARTVGGRMCPAGSVPKVHTYATTMWDDGGFEQPARGFEVRCVNSDGELVQDLGATPFFIWTGALGAVGLALSVLLAVVLAVPVGRWIERFRQRRAQGQP